MNRKATNLRGMSNNLNLEFLNLVDIVVANKSKSCIIKLYFIFYGDDDCVFTPISREKSFENKQNLSYCHGVWSKTGRKIDHDK